MLLNLSLLAQMPIYRLLGVKGFFVDVHGCQTVLNVGAKA